ncbi:unnamed protein product [Adineta ricciae]|uniref:Uncharacterized protein n=1 Tax=Adineta ricciae TaxID=249248 RepID=A0A814W9E9_ADIRI|nr:unnamed protein product [Adineta ricciae]CAF1558839.1 unnamed protein product [Adineta ricciae]
MTTSDIMIQLAGDCKDLHMYDHELSCHEKHLMLFSNGNLTPDYDIISGLYFSIIGIYTKYKPDYEQALRYHAMRNQMITEDMVYILIQKLYIKENMVVAAADSHMQLALIHLAFHEYDLSYVCFQIALQMVDGIELDMKKQHLATIERKLALVCSKQKKYAAANEHLEKAIKYYQEDNPRENNEKVIVYIQERIADNCCGLDNFTAAIEYYLDASKFYASNNCISGHDDEESLYFGADRLASISEKLADIFVKLHQYTIAKKLLIMSLSIHYDGMPDLEEFQTISESRDETSVEEVAVQMEMLLGKLKNIEMKNDDATQPAQYEHSITILLEDYSVWRQRSRSKPPRQIETSSDGYKIIEDANLIRFIIHKNKQKYI